MSKAVFWGILALIPVATSATLSAQTGIGEDLTVRLFAPDTVVSKSEPIILGLDLVNMTDHELGFFAVPGGQHAELFYDVIGRDTDGKEIARTEYGKYAGGRSHMMGARIQRIIKPDQSYRAFMEVSKIFDLSQPGRYTFQVKNKYPPSEDNNPGSNVVTVEVK